MMSFLQSIIAEAKASASAPALGGLDATARLPGAQGENAGPFSMESAGTILGDGIPFSAAPLMAPEARPFSAPPVIRDASYLGTSHPGAPDPTPSGRMAAAVPRMESVVVPVTSTMVEEGNSRQEEYREQPAAEMVPLNGTAPRTGMIAPVTSGAEDFPGESAWQEQPPLAVPASNISAPVHGQAQAPVAQPGEPVTPQVLGAESVARTEQSPVPVIDARHADAQQPPATPSAIVKEERTQTSAVDHLFRPVYVDKTAFQERLPGEPTDSTVASALVRPGSREITAGTRSHPHRETLDGRMDALREAGTRSPSIPVPAADLPFPASQPPPRETQHPTRNEFPLPSAGQPAPVEKEPVEAAAGRPGNAVAPPRSVAVRSTERTAPPAVAASTSTRVYPKAMAVPERTPSAAVSPQGTKPAPRAPEVRIGQVDVFIEAPKRQVAPDRAPGKGAGALSSRLYLRRI